MLRDHKKALKSKLTEETDPDTKKRIQIALNKLEAGKTYAIESHLPNLSIALRTGKDTTLRVGENVVKSALQEVASLAAGGAIWEIRDAYANPYEYTFMERLQRLFLAILDKLRGLTFVRFAKELALEIFNAVLGFLKSTFKSIGHFFSLLGKAVLQVWESICDYCTGKIKSFSDLVTVVTKSLSAVGFGFLAIALEKQLIAIGIPTPIAAIMAAAFAGLGITLINKILDGGIEGLVFAITSAFSGAEAARLRYESIAEYCDEILPKIVEEREKFQKMVDAYYAERANIFAYSFSEIRSSVAAKDSLKLLASLESLNKAYGRTLGWSTQEEFDEMMVNSHRPFIL
jgi:hypothetical protein